MARERQIALETRVDDEFEFLRSGAAVDGYGGAWMAGAEDA